MSSCVVVAECFQCRKLLRSNLKGDGVVAFGKILHEWSLHARQEKHDVEVTLVGPDGAFCFDFNRPILGDVHPNMEGNVLCGWVRAFQTRAFKVGLTP